MNKINQIFQQMVETSENWATERLKYLIELFDILNKYDIAVSHAPVHHSTSKYDCF